MGIKKSVGGMENGPSRTRRDGLDQCLPGNKVGDVGLETWDVGRGGKILPAAVAAWRGVAWLLAAASCCQLRACQMRAGCISSVCTSCLVVCN